MLYDTKDVKMNGGPAHGKMMTVGKTSYQFFIEAPMREKVFYNFMDDHKQAPMPRIRRGEYVKSHRVLKDGTQVFQWMGWIDGKV